MDQLLKQSVITDTLHQRNGYINIPNNAPIIYVITSNSTGAITADTDTIKTVDFQTLYQLENPLDVQHILTQLTSNSIVYLGIMTAEKKEVINPPKTNNQNHTTINIHHLEDNIYLNKTIIR